MSRLNIWRKLILEKDILELVARNGGLDLGEIVCRGLLVLLGLLMNGHGDLLAFHRVGEVAFDLCYPLLRVLN